MALYIGLMSGTSLDGVDGVLIDFGSVQGPPIALRAHQHHPFDATLRAELLALNVPGDNELERAELAANAIARCYAAVVQACCVAVPPPPREVLALGAHGQTVRHRPGASDGVGYTSQLLNGALLAELTGIDVVCDLRRRDIAAGGQGAPLAPGLHAALFAAPGESRAVLNLGGIANLTLLGADGVCAGVRLRASQRVARRLVPTTHGPALRRWRPLGRGRTSARGLVGWAAGRALLRPAPAQEHRARPVSHGLAGRPPGAPRAGGAACRCSGYVDCTDRAQRCASIAAPRQRNVTVDGLRGWRAQRAADARAGGAAACHCA